MPGHQDIFNEAMTNTERRALATRLLTEKGRERFPEGDFSLSVDASGTIWIKHDGAGRSVGIQPWQLRVRSVDEVLDRAAAKLGL